MAQIGPYQFGYLFGNVPTLAPAIEVLEKFGEDGYIRRQVGERTPPFILTSQGTYDTEVEARNAVQGFADMVADGSVGLIKDDVNYTTQPTKKYKVNVLDVNQVSLKEMACTTSGRNWELIVEWTLILEPV